MSLQEPTVVPAGSVMAYNWGGQGPPLLLLHANGFNAYSYKPMVSLLQESFHVYAIDFRGHGRSPTQPAESLSLKLFAEDVMVALRTLRIVSTPCYVFGHSLGGVVALMCAVTYPKLFAAVYVFEPVVCSPVLASKIELQPGTELLASIAERRRGTFATRSAAMQNLRGKHPYAMFQPDAFDAYMAEGLRPAADGGDTVSLACTPATEAAVFRFAARDAIQHVFHRLGSVLVPVVVACGADTGEEFMWLPEGSKEVAAALPQGIHVQFQALEHMGPMTHPTLVANHMRLCFGAARTDSWGLLPPRMVLPAAPSRL